MRPARYRVLIRGPYALFTLTAVVLLLATAIQGEWTVFVPFLLVVALWVWWTLTRAPDIR